MDFIVNNLLTLILFTPILVAILVVMLPKNETPDPLGGSGR
jgi:hypothetical protein